VCNNNHYRLFNTTILLLFLFWAIVTVNGCTANSPDESVTLVVVTAHNCESCTATEDTIDFIQRNYYEIKIKTVELHNPEGAMYVSRYHLWRVPVYLFVDKNGKELYRLEGEQTRNQLKEAVDIVKHRINNKN
jgi:thiol:disulfide interchange protein